MCMGDAFSVPFILSCLGDRYDSNDEMEPRFVKGVAIRPVPIALGNFWVTFTVGSNLVGSSNLEQLLPFWAKLGLAHISNLKKFNDFTENFKLFEFPVCLLTER